MNDDTRSQSIALFRLAVLGDLIHLELPRGVLRRALERKSAELRTCHDGMQRRIAAKTIQSWLYAYRKHGFDGLIPKRRRDRGKSRAIPEHLQSLVLDMKREDPGRSVPMIMRELRGAGLIDARQLSASAITRFLKSHGLSGPKLELRTPARHRFVAAMCGELWQGDACHGPKLFDPRSGREVRVKIFALLDDKSRLIPYLRGSFHERQEDFLRVLLGAVQRRGLPRSLLLDNHGSFTGSDVRVACGKLGIRLVFARPYDGPSKGKIERFWRTLRAQVLDRLDMREVRTLDALNVRLMTWASTDYNQRPHAGLSGRTPLSVFEEDSECIRFVDEPEQLDSAFQASVVRAVKNDSTCSWRGKVYEVPPHLRNGQVTLHHDLRRPDEIWIVDGATQVPLREVDPVANSRRPRLRNDQPGPQACPKTGLNSVEDLLDRALRRQRKERDGDEQGGAACVPS